MTTTCPNCGNPTAAGARFCPQCGTGIAPPASQFCASCGQALAPNAAFCASCGQPAGARAQLPSYQPPAPGAPSRPVPWALVGLGVTAIVVVGVWGAVALGLGKFGAGQGPLGAILAPPTPTATPTVTPTPAPTPTPTPSIPLTQYIGTWGFTIGYPTTWEVSESTDAVVFGPRGRTDLPFIGVMIAEAASSTFWGANKLWATISPDSVIMDIERSLILEAKAKGWRIMGFTKGTRTIGGKPVATALIDFIIGREQSGESSKLFFAVWKGRVSNLALAAGAQDARDWAQTWPLFDAMINSLRP